ncbi:hypothetical protein K469DRAFT_688003 [Zopfia rhizophila CBS 207.26]|uniref:Flavodoxin-like domain-containing protein n=1 Tax=Zopfia rhizophila CBS 207.26 TaxID=1314779 RepID=A0A6A6E5M8_9PEZI|nr:hypothetical protein K469DRAFT_688003 [Zopfia rhizophila CBS 207.26]
MADPSCTLHLKVALALKPDNFRIIVRRRPGRDPGSLGGGHSGPVKRPTSDGGIDGIEKQQTKPIKVLYGSQAGTCKSYAEELETNASRFGFQAAVRTLDSATEQILKDQPPS